MIKVIGGIIIVWGILDLGLYFLDMDIYHLIGVYPPEIIWQYSPFIAFIVGGALYYHDDPDHLDD